MVGSEADWWGIMVVGSILEGAGRHHGLDYGGHVCEGCGYMYLHTEYEY